MNAVRDSRSWPRPSALIPATIVGLTRSLGYLGSCPLRCNTKSLRLRYGSKNSTVSRLNSPPSCCSSCSCVSLTSSAVTRSACLTFMTRKASAILFSSCDARFAAVWKSAVFPTCTTVTSSGLPCTIAPLPALESVCGLVIEDGDTRNNTFAAAAEPSTRACASALSDLRSPRNSSTLPRP